MTFRWRADDGPTLNAGSLAAIFRGSGPALLENHIFFVIFQGGRGGEGEGGGRTPLWIHTLPGHLKKVFV